MSGTATNRTNITLPVDVSNEILQKVQEESAIMRLATQIALPGRGTSINVITSDPEAAWVDETAAKPVSNPGLTTKVMQAYKLQLSYRFLTSSAETYPRCMTRWLRDFRAHLDRSSTQPLFTDPRLAAILTCWHLVLSRILVPTHMLDL